MVRVALHAHHLAVFDMRDQRTHVGAIVGANDSNGFHPPPPSSRSPQHSWGEEDEALLLLGRDLILGRGGIGLGAARLGARAHAAGHAEAVLEALHAAAAIDVLAHAGPRRMGLGIDVEAHGRALLAPGRPRLEAGAVGHDNRDLVVVGMGLLFHANLQRKGPIADRSARTRRRVYRQRALATRPAILRLSAVKWACRPA